MSAVISPVIRQPTEMGRQIWKKGYSRPIVRERVRTVDASWHRTSYPPPAAAAGGGGRDGDGESVTKRGRRGIPSHEG